MWRKINLERKQIATEEEKGGEIHEVERNIEE
jgi:hypothetical protein